MAENEKQITVVDRMPGYAQVTLQGTCADDVTVEDVRKRFYHPYFGGARAWVRDGRWGCIVYTD